MLVFLLRLELFCNNLELEHLNTTSFICVGVDNTMPEQEHVTQVGRAPLHVAAQTGNLESLIRLLDVGAGRAPRDRVSLT